MSEKQQKQDEAKKGIDTSKISVDDKGQMQVGEGELDQVVGGLPIGGGGKTNCFNCVNTLRCLSKDL